jgi:hypothetical protein
VTDSNCAVRRSEEVRLAGLVAARNDALVLPAGIRTRHGTVEMAVFALETDTMRPPVGAGPFRTTEACELAPPGTCGGSSTNATKEGASIVSVADTLDPFSAAVMFAVVLAVTAVVAAVNVSVVWPAKKVTVDGTVAAGLLLERAATIPAGGAGPLSVTVPMLG